MSPDSVGAGQEESIVLSIPSRKGFNIEGQVLMK